MIVSRVASFMVTAGILLSVCLSYGNPRYVTDTPHNLSASGTGTVHATTEIQVCIFCHTPHESSSSAPLWNRYEIATSYTLYPSGGSIQSTIGQPDGSSRICLSCHDGTTALGLVKSRPSVIGMTGVTGQGRLNAGRTNVGTALHDDHPISFVPSLTDVEIRNPVAGDTVQLDANGKVQCSSCHNPHDNRNGKFLAKPNTQSAICLSCHQKRNWSTSIHGAPPAHGWYDSLRTHACANCHDVHSAPTSKPLTILSEETLCLACHDAVQNQSWEVASRRGNMSTEFLKASRHPITATSGIHDPGEGPQGSTPTPSKFLPEQNPSATRHVECVDCHNPHSINIACTNCHYLHGTPPPGFSATLNNVWGITSAGTKISIATAEYQICFKCHSDSRNLPSGTKNKRTELQTSNLSYHPIIGVGRNTTVPSLISPWTINSTMTCVDCHSNSDTTGPRGPHGSAYTKLLVRNFNRSTTLITESAAQYALCYRCHNRTSIINNGSFAYHNKHIVGERYSCFKCHNSHGVAGAQHLIRFDTTDVNIQRSSSGRLEYQHLTGYHGRCYIRCHGEDHNPYTY